jgi:hypothetical protein
MKLGWFRSFRTPSLSESFRDVGSRSEGPGGEGRELTEVTPAARSRRLGCQRRDCSGCP